MEDSSSRIDDPVDRIRICEIIDAFLGVFFCYKNGRTKWYIQ